MFWPNTDQTTARGNLRVVLSNLKRLLPGALHVTRDVVALSDGVEERVDAQRFVRAATGGLARANASLQDARPLLEDALRAYGGPLLDGLDLTVGEDYDAWVAAERNHLESAGTWTAPSSPIASTWPSRSPSG
jgi:DNA-binding SARP family transcriptional activator